MKKAGMKHVLAGGLLGASALSATVYADGTSPNILLITADDMGMTAGCYGDSLAVTPNLDRLALEGVRFVNAYITDASCSPSRSSILTGLYPHQTGQIGLTGFRPVLGGSSYAMHDGIPTLPKLLKDVGYYTAILGKLHVDPPALFPFDDAWKESLYNPPLTRDVRRLAELAGEFIQAAGDKPFFLYVNYFDPHRPYDAAANQCRGLPEKPYTANDVKPFEFLGNAADLAQVAAYYNCVNRMDVGLGLLFDQLKQFGKYDNTLIIFLSDNGPDFTRAKTTCYEAGVQIPFIVKWPGVSRTGLRSEEFVSSVDILPTLLDAVGSDCPPVDGDSLRAVLSGECLLDWRRVVFAEYTSHTAAHYYPRRSIRNGNLKLIHNMNSPRINPVPRRGVGNLVLLENGPLKMAFETDLHPPEWELYDLGKDPCELVNLAGSPECSTILKSMQQSLFAQQQENNDPLIDLKELERMNREHGL